jgi:glycogen debranching enzyme
MKTVSLLRGEGEAVADAQFTRIDAKVGNWVVMPHHGKPVENQELYTRALEIEERLAAKWVRQPMR